MRGVQKPLQISENFYLGSNSAGATATRLVFEDFRRAIAAIRVQHFAGMRFVAKLLGYLQYDAAAVTCPKAE